MNFVSMVVKNIFCSTETNPVCVGIFASSFT